MKMIDCNQCSLAELNFDEMTTIDGGGIWREIAWSLIENWDEFAAGVKAGYHAQ